MSGGSMDYLYAKVQDAQFLETTQLRVAFRLHLQRVAKAMRAIEWNDSGDGDYREDALIEAVLGIEDTPKELAAAEGANPDLPYQYEDTDERRYMPRTRDFYEDGRKRALDDVKIRPGDAVARPFRDDA